MNDRCKDLNFKVYTDGIMKAHSGSKRIIRGYASVSDILDRQNEVITHAALERAKTNLLENHTIFYEHKHSELPVGKVINVELDDKGLLITVEFTQSDHAKSIWTLIEEGILNSFSIGGRVIHSEDQRDKQGNLYNEITDIELFETSIVGLPANPAAKFELVSKSFNMAITEQMRKREVERNMAKNIVEKVKEAEDVVKVEEKVADVIETKTVVKVDKQATVLPDVDNKVVTTVTESDVAKALEETVSVLDDKKSDSISKDVLIEDVIDEAIDEVIADTIAESEDCSLDKKILDTLLSISTALVDLKASNNSVNKKDIKEECYDDGSCANCSCGAHDKKSFIDNVPEEAEVEATLSESKKSIEVGIVKQEVVIQEKTVDNAQKSNVVSDLDTVKDRKSIVNTETFIAESPYRTDGIDKDNKEVTAKQLHAIKEKRWASMVWGK